MERRLAAILAADVVGYSRLMGQDEAGTLRALKALRAEVIDPKIAEHKGRIFKSTGDGVLAEFSSVVNAVSCAVEIQRNMAGRALQLRVGINLGDVIVEDGDVFGDGVNIASRVEGVAHPGGVAVSSSAFEHVGKRLALQFEDMGEHPLKNIDQPVRVYSVRLNGSATETPRTPTLSLPDNPSIAVLPFQNLSGDADQEYFADGIVEEIITSLSRIRWLFVIARNSSFTFKGRNVDVKQVGRELGVRYVLEGSVRRAADRIRITGQLIDTATGSHIWAERYDGNLADVFDLQDRIAESVVGAIHPSILTAEIERSGRKRPESLVAYDYVLRALPLVWSLDKNNTEEAQKLLEAALAAEPNYPLALSLLAWCHGQRATYNWSQDLSQERREAVRLAQRAAAISRDDPMVLAVLGAALTLSRDYRTAGEHLERALALDPNSAWAWNRSGWLNVHLGNGELAIQQFERAMRLSPFDPSGFVCLFGIADAHFLMGQYEQAISWSRRGLSQAPTAVWHLRVLVPALIHAGRREEAGAAYLDLMAAYPGLTASLVKDSLPFHPEMLARILSGLQEAGVPG